MDKMCFASNFADVRDAFKDYMWQYMSETEGRKGFDSYDHSKSFAEKEKKMNALMLKEISALSGVDFADDKFVSKEMYAGHPNVRWASFAVVNSLIDMVLPEVLIKTIGLYTETRNIGYGDSAAFNVEPNELFYVSKVGMGQRTVDFQRQWQGQTTVIPENRAITVYVSLYRVLCGLDSLAKFVSKAILSVEANITKEVYTAFATAMEGLPTTPVDGNLKVAGYSQASAVKLAQTVSAWNQGAKAVFVGTQLALQNILPDNANYRYFLDDDYARLGYVRTAFGYDTLVLPQLADWENPYKTLLRDDRIYVLSPSSQKLVKLVYEGGSRSNTMDAYDAANLLEQTTIYKSYGIAIATNSIAGVITLD